MQRRGWAGGCYAVAAMLAAAASGRVLDSGGRLPGVGEAAAVRGSGLAWLVALGCAAALGVRVARGWLRTPSLRAVAPAVVRGQCFGFLAAEAAARAARGHGLLDPDGLLGAALQAALALALLSVLAVGWAVLRAAAPLAAAEPPAADRDRLRLPVVLPPKSLPGKGPARAPPVRSCTCAA